VTRLFSLINWKDPARHPPHRAGRNSGSAIIREPGGGMLFGAIQAILFVVVLRCCASCA